MALLTTARASRSRRPRAYHCGSDVGVESELTRLFVVNHPIPYMGPASTRILFQRLYKWYVMRSGAKTVR